LQDLFARSVMEYNQLNREYTRETKTGIVRLRSRSPAINGVMRGEMATRTKKSTSLSPRDTHLTPGVGLLCRFKGSLRYNHFREELKAASCIIMTVRCVHIEHGEASPLQHHNLSPCNQSDLTSPLGPCTMETTDNSSMHQSHRLRPAINKTRV
jgi:hypothetical protein